MECGRSLCSLRFASTDYHSQFQSQHAVHTLVRIFIHKIVDICYMTPRRLRFHSFILARRLQIRSDASSPTIAKFVRYRSGCSHFHEKRSNFCPLKNQCHLSSCGESGGSKQQNAPQELAIPIASSQSEDPPIKLL